MCELYIIRPDYQILWDEKKSRRPSPRIPLPVADCIHRGDAVPAGEIARAGFDPNRTHYRCGAMPSYGIVTDCKTCGTVFKKAPQCDPSCGGYDDGRTVIDQGGSGMAGNGIGDALMGLVAVAKWKQENPNKQVVYRVHNSTVPWVKLFHGYDDVQLHDAPNPRAKQLNRNYHTVIGAELRTPRWERYAANIGVVGTTIPELREPGRIKDIGRAYAGCVVLVPFSMHAEREWPLPHWHELESLLISAGYKTVVLHHAAKDGKKTLAGFRGLLAVGLDAERVAGLLLNARLVVGNDSGMAHLAGLLKRPTIAVCGRYPGERIFGCYPSVKCMNNMQMFGAGEVFAAAKEHCEAETVEYRSETARHRDKVLRYCRGNGLDLGSGGDPVVPTAIQVEPDAQYTPDLGGKYPVQLRGDATRLHWFADGALDYVYSSHLLEDFADWEPILREWTRVIRPGGYLVLLIPDKSRFAAAVAGGQPGNDAHQHEGRVGELSEYAERLGMEAVEDRFAGGETDYNILFVGRKK